MLTLYKTSEYRKNLKLMIKRGKNPERIDAVIDTLLAEKPLDPRRRDHALHGDFEGFRECHIENDWLLVYIVNKNDLILTASRTGTHSDIFG